MIRKSLLALCVLAVAACSPAHRGARRGLQVAALGDSPLLGRHVEVSPDGRHLAYSMQVEGLAAIYVANAGRHEPGAAHPRHLGYDAKWSPDGRWIAYYSDHNADCGWSQRRW